MEKLKMPDFATEREEADWWYANQDRIAEAYRQEHNLPKFDSPSIDFVGIDIEGEDARLIQERAAARGMAPHVYAEALLRDALHRNEAA